MIEGKLSAARGRATCGGTGAQAPKKPEVGGLEGVHLRQPLGDQLLAEVLQALAPNLPQLLIESLVLSGSIIPDPSERPELARADFPTRARPDAASLRVCCILKAVLTLLPRTGNSRRAGMARNYPLFSVTRPARSSGRQAPTWLASGCSERRQANRETDY